MNGQVLKLNAAYMPLEIISWKDAITAWAAGKVEIIEEYEDRVLKYGYDRHLDTFKGAMNMPAVVRLIHFVKPTKDVKFFQSFTRKNVYDRDNGECQYCGKELSLREMTYDHVHPQSEGGETNWTNIVCSCLKCNSKKANKTLKEARMKLMNEPVAPKIAEDYHGGCLEKLKRIKNITDNEKWVNYLYWNTTLQD